MVERLLAAIDQYQEDVFEYRAAELADSFMAVINAIELWVDGSLNEKGRAFLNNLLETMLVAYQNKDYLLVADLAEYELKPLVLNTRI